MNLFLHKMKNAKENKQKERTNKNEKKRSKYYQVLKLCWYECVLKTYVYVHELAQNIINKAPTSKGKSPYKLLLLQNS